MEPEIRFCTARDGTGIGYGVMGEGRPLLLVYSWGNNIETEWENAGCRAAHEKLARDRQVVVLMRRGFGSSQRDVEDVSLEAQVSDIEAVVDSLSAASVDMWAFQDATGPAAAFTAGNPEKVSKLVLWDAFRRGEEIFATQSARSVIELVRANWNLATRSFASLAFPSGPPEEERWLARQFRQSISPEMAARYLDFLFRLDLTSYLPRIQVPTLVLHRRRDRVMPASASRDAASMIPGARFVMLDGDIAYSWLGDTSYLDIVDAFLGGPRAAGDNLESGLRTILFTDLADHTAMMQRLGDRKGRELLREHERITREVLAGHGGDEIKAMGDGFMASFGSAQKALECAVALQRRFGDEGRLAGHEQVRLHIGVNAGEPIAEDDDLFGTSVIMAARVASKAAAGEILVTNVVRELMAGKGFQFTDRGEMDMKGFEEPVRLYEVRWE